MATQNTLKRIVHWREKEKEKRKEKKTERKKKRKEKEKKKNNKLNGAQKTKGAKTISHKKKQIVQETFTVVQAPRNTWKLHSYNICN